jgi:hypothetical protein
MECTHIPSQETCLAAVSAALGDVVREDQVLLVLDAHELSLVHRFAIYLEARLQPELRQCGLSIDLDYDRHGDGQKWLPPRLDQEGDRRFRPDLVVHRRKNDSKNLLVVEWKKHANSQTLEDLRERFGLLLSAENKRSAYGYKLGVLVNSSDDGIQ